MKHLLILFIFLIAILGSGCAVHAPDSKELKFKDPNYPDTNYLVLSEDLTKPGTGTFTLITSEYTAGGTYTETSEAYSLRYAEYPVGVTLKKVKNGIDIGKGECWYE
jgi:hypothetical protein